MNFLSYLFINQMRSSIPVILINEHVGVLNNHIFSQRSTTQYVLTRKNQELNLNARKIASA